MTDIHIHYLHGRDIAQLAMTDAGFPLDKPLGERAGVIVGSGMGGLSTLEDTHLTAVNRGHRKVNPFFIPSIIVNLAAGQISIRYGADGYWWISRFWAADQPEWAEPRSASVQR